MGRIFISNEASDAVVSNNFTETLGMDTKNDSRVMLPTAGCSQDGTKSDFKNFEFNQTSIGERISARILLDLTFEVLVVTSALGRCGICDSININTSSLGGTFSFPTEGSDWQGRRVRAEDMTRMLYADDRKESFRRGGYRHGQIQHQSCLCEIRSTPSDRFDLVESWKDIFSSYKHMYILIALLKRFRDTPFH